MNARMPVVFLPHGGGPVTHVDVGIVPRGEADALATYWRMVPRLPRSPVQALLVISAHWEERLPTVMTSLRPPMLYDYGGMPPEAYRLTWPAPGAPAVAARVRDLLSRAGIPTVEDSQRGFDHGAFTPLKQSYPDAKVPAIQLSLKSGLNASEHLAIGRAIAPLRDAGIFIVGSGDTFHNMREFRTSNSVEKFNKMRLFDEWLTGVVTGDPLLREEQLATWTAAPFARFCHPREEHLLPLMVIAGAAGDDPGVVTWTGTFMGSRQVGYHFTAS
jgi:aromatic ring-opening dioxygenase catalytic subunit (LigB family)